MSKYASKVINIALAEVGYLEKASNSNLDNKTANAGKANYTKYARDLDNIAGFYNGKKNGYAWCDVFVDWCFVQAFGVNVAKALLCQPNKSLGAGCPYSMNYYKAKKRLYIYAKVGDQIFFKDSSGEISHTGLVYAVDSKYVYTVEGNTSTGSGVVANGGGVCKKKYELTYTKIAGYGRPAYDAESKPAPETIINNNEVCTVNVRLLKKGAKGADVKALQTLLIGYGYSCGKWGADGDFGSDTDAAVRKYQKAKQITVDGEVGAITWGKLLGV